MEMASVRGALFGGVVLGLFMVISSAVEGEPLWSAIWIGVISGVVFASLMAMVQTRDLPVAVRALSSGDRRSVARTVRKGSPVQDARLAPAVIAYAGHLRRQDRPALGRPAIEVLCLGLIALFCGYRAVSRGLDGATAPAVWNGLLAATILVVAVVGPRRREERLQRLDRVERSAGALLGNPS